MNPSKPWDTLREQPNPLPPIRPGEWKTSRGATVTLHARYENGASISLSGARANFSIESWREIGEFLIELADQIEGK